MKLKSFKEALEKSIEQWEWVVSQPEGTWKSNYPPIQKTCPGGGCYLCEWGNQSRTFCNDCTDSNVWNTPYCIFGESPYCRYEDAFLKGEPTKKHARVVLKALKKALKRLEDAD